MHIDYFARLASRYSRLSDNIANLTPKISNFNQLGVDDLNELYSRFDSLHTAKGKIDDLLESGSISFSGISRDHLITLVSKIEKVTPCLVEDYVGYKLLTTRDGFQLKFYLTDLRC